MQAPCPLRLRSRNPKAIALPNNPMADSIRAPGCIILKTAVAYGKHESGRTNVIE
jgi:hypothetical protein